MRIPTDKVSAGKSIAFHGFGYNVSCEYLLYTFNLKHGMFKSVLLKRTVVSVVNQIPKSSHDYKWQTFIWFITEK